MAPRSLTSFYLPAIIHKTLNKKQIKISKKDLKNIYGDSFQSFEEKIVPNCRCVQCKASYTSTIINYKIFLNDLNDIILEGSCAKCKGPINRYLETGEVDKYQKVIYKVRRKFKKKGVLG